MLSSVLSSVLGEKAMLGLYLANASDRAGERKGFFDGAVQGGRDAIVAQERGAQRAADDEAARMRARGTPDPVVSGYLFKEYYNAAARRELGSGLLDEAQFLGDYLGSVPARDEKALRQHRPDCPVPYSPCIKLTCVCSGQSSAAEFRRFWAESAGWFNWDIANLLSVSFRPLPEPTPATSALDTSRGVPVSIFRIVL